MKIKNEKNKEGIWMKLTLFKNSKLEIYPTYIYFIFCFLNKKIRVCKEKVFKSLYRVIIIFYF